MEYTDIKIQNMQSLSAYRRQLQSNPHLAYLFLELTDQCNLSCLHCGGSHANYTQLDLGLAKKALDSVARRMDPAKVMVCFTGGEPFMYRHFFELAEYVARKGFPWGMTSNGIMITPETVASWRLINIEPIERAREHPELLLEPEELKYILDYIRNKRRSADVPMEVTYGCSHYLTTEYEREVRDYYFICGSSGWHESGVGGG